MRDDLAIIIPALNEAATIGGVVASLAGVGRIVVVDDGSSDATGKIAQDNGAEVVRHAANRGYDAALGSGFARADELGCAYAITLDADGQHPAEMIAAYVAALDGGADLVLGIRDRLQRVGEQVFAFATKSRFGIRDPLCGMKGYRLGLYRALGHFDSYQSIGTELMLHAVSNGCNFIQIPLDTRERADAPRFGRLARANWRILRAMAIGMARYGMPGRAKRASPGARRGRGSYVGRLGIGGAQFGLDYGATNKTGKVAPQAVAAILKRAREAGITILDTAAQYGDSEKVIGAALNGETSGGTGGFRIVTKTADLRAAGDESEAVKLFKQGLELSISRLGRGNIYGLLFHHAGDLLGPWGDKLWSVAEKARDTGRVRRIGVSVYSGEEIAAILDRFRPDIVQMPFNAFDGRPDADGSFKRLEKAGVELHVRSVFLQGVLLAEPDALPAHLAGLAEPLTQFREAVREAGISLEAGLLAAVLERKAVARLVVGVTSLEELEALIAAASEAEAVKGRIDFSRFGLQDPAILNPSLWPSLQPR